MGTRGAVGVKLNNKYYVTYNHWDSYPSELGKDVVQFCQKIDTIQNGWKKFSKNIEKVELVKNKDKASKKLQNKYAKYCDESVSTQDSSEWYCLLRNLQGISIFNEILEGNVEHMIDSFNFLKDSLFCEYAYIINLDDKKLEFYQGFNKSVDTNSPLPIEQISKNDYYPVKFVGSVNFEDIEDFDVEKIENNSVLMWSK